jgi:hypothetical protein
MAFLKIRAEQLDALATPQAELFEERLARFLCEQFPEAADEPPDELRAAVREQSAKADSYGLKTERQAAVYVTCAWLFGPDFDTEFPAALEMLASGEYPPEDKADWLERWAESLFAALEED